MTEDMGGPYVGLACFCERVMEEKDGVVSLIRVVDRFQFTGGVGSPEQMPPVNLNTYLVLNLRSGMARGNHHLRLLLISPSGAEVQQVNFSMLFEGEDRSAQAVINLQFQAQEEGLYWVDVFYEGVLLTRIPLRLMWQRIAT